MEPAPDEIVYPLLLIEEQGHAAKQLRSVEYHSFYCYNWPPDGQGSEVDAR